MKTTAKKVLKTVSDFLFEGIWEEENEDKELYSSLNRRINQIQEKNYKKLQKNYKLFISKDFFKKNNMLMPEAQAELEFQSFLLEGLKEHKIDRLFSIEEV